MASMIFVNMAVKDLEKSKAFFRALGFTFNDQFTDETAACLVISEHIYAMLQTHAKFKEFVTKPIVDSAAATEMINALAVDSRADVDRLADAAIAAGAGAPRPPSDYGFMYLRAFEDIDGHVWEVFWMDPAHVQ